jgi:hypothetical protein
VNSSGRPKSSHPITSSQEYIGVESREKTAPIANTFSTDRAKKSHNRMLSNGNAPIFTHHSTLNGIIKLFALNKKYIVIFLYK